MTAAKLRYRVVWQVVDDRGRWVRWTPDMDDAEPDRTTPPDLPGQESVDGR